MAVIALEIVGALAIVLGWKTRVAAVLLAGFSVLTALTFHNNLADQTQMIMFSKTSRSPAASCCWRLAAPAPSALTDAQPSRTHGRSRISGETSKGDGD